MNKVDQALKELILAIKEQECYIEYQKALQNFKKDKEMYARLNEFRRKNMEYHMGEKNLMDESVLWREYQDFLTKEEVSVFLSWEQKVTGLYQHVYDTIAEESELDCSFLDD